MSNVKYQKLTTESEGDNASSEAITMNPLLMMDGVSSQDESRATKDSGTKVTDESFRIKVLFKERSFDIVGVTPESTVQKLKEKIEKATNVSSNVQRLIFAGKNLKPDNQSLNSFKITNNASVHLFPLPPPQASRVVTDSNNYPHQVSGINVVNNNSAVINAVSVSPHHEAASHAHIHFEPDVSHSAKEVKLWCIILLFLSAFTLFQYIDFIGNFLTTGKVGSSVLHDIVGIVEVLCSMGGVYVAQLGLRSLTTMNAVEIARYTRHLSMLAMACIAFRILWVIDLMTFEQHKTNEARDNTNTTTPSDPNSNTTDDDEHGARREPNHMLNVGIQLSVIAAFCIYAWGSCVLRAHRLRSVVEAYNSREMDRQGISQV